MRIVLAASILGLALGSASAQEADRFTMEKTPDGYIRLDNSTGKMSVCKETGAQLVCRLAADDRDAYQDEVDQLQGRLDALEKRVTALESGGGAQTSNVPTEEEFEQTMSYMQRFFKGFVDIVKDLDKDLSKPETPQPVPNRT